MRHVLFLALLLATALPLPGQAQEGGDRLSLEALTATPPGGGEPRHSYARHSYASHGYAQRSLIRHGYARPSYARRSYGRHSYARHGYARHSDRGGSRRHGYAPMHVQQHHGVARHAHHAIIHPRRHR